MPLAEVAVQVEEEEEDGRVVLLAVESRHEAGMWFERRATAVRKEA